jgi:hypothetical protein
MIPFLPFFAAFAALRGNDLPVSALSGLGIIQSEH